MFPASSSNTPPSGPAPFAPLNVRSTLKVCACATQASASTSTSNSALIVFTTEVGIGDGMANASRSAGGLSKGGAVQAASCERKYNIEPVDCGAKLKGSDA